MLWVDKHRPRQLAQLDYHEPLTNQLQKMVRFLLMRELANANEHSLCHPQATAGDFPHLLFYGPTGAGKKTRIMALLRELFDAGVEKVIAFNLVQEPSIWLVAHLHAFAWPALVAENRSQRF